MSLQKVWTQPKLILSNWNKVSVLVRQLSRRSNNVDTTYKTVKSRKSIKDEGSLVWRDPNFEILASPSGFPFFLPGNISPAWYDKRTTVQTDYAFVMKPIDIKDIDGSEENIICQVQECPAVLRQTVYNLFPNNNLEACELSVVTIVLKSNKVLLLNREFETEQLAQTFVLTANNICDKLRKAGYWADFINPFSGKPFLLPFTTNGTSYETDEKLGCLDFQISEINECKVIAIDTNSEKNNFVGSLFTNAPSNKYRLNNIFVE